MYVGTSDNEIKSFFFFFFAFTVTRLLSNASNIVLLAYNGNKDATWITCGETLKCSSVGQSVMLSLSLSLPLCRISVALSLLSLSLVASLSSFCRSLLSSIMLSIMLSLSHSSSIYRISVVLSCRSVVY